MKALILNSGTGSRMGDLTKDRPKCLVELENGTTILDRQLYILEKCDISEVIITTGRYDKEIRDTCSNHTGLKFTFVKNELYDSTNYIYSIYKAKEHLNDDIILLHGDLVFEEYVLLRLINFKKSCVATNTFQVDPEKDFKAIVKDNRVLKISVGLTDNFVTSQPAYKLTESDMKAWIDNIVKHCDSGKIGHYAEDALNEILDTVEIIPIDFQNIICTEVDTPDDLSIVNGMLEKIIGRKVYMSMSSDVIHDGHMNMIQYGASLGELTVGIMSDEATATYKHYPILSFEKKKKIISKIKGVARVVKQEKLSYSGVISELKPDIIVHGDDWRHGIQSPIRLEAVELLEQNGGILIEPPYTRDKEHEILENKVKAQLSIPENRRASLKKILKLKKTIRIMEAHNGLTGLIVESTKVSSQDRKSVV